jgi:uracil-DNA glycosylase
MKKCEPFLKMEFQILKPHLVVALGDVAFDMLIPGVSIKPHSGKMIVSDKFGVKVFPIDVNNEKEFTKGIVRLCKLIKKF